MTDVFRDSYKSMLLGVEVSVVATFGLVLFDSQLAELWLFVLLVGLLVTFVGTIQPAAVE